MSKQYRTPKQIRDAANTPWPAAEQAAAEQGITRAEWQDLQAAQAREDARRDIAEEDPEFAFVVDYEDQDFIDPRDFETW